MHRRRAGTGLRRDRISRLLLGLLAVLPGRVALASEVPRSCCAAIASAETGTDAADVYLELRFAREVICTRIPASQLRAHTRRTRGDRFTAESGSLPASTP
jgi:hypothetical protein